MISRAGCWVRDSLHSKTIDSRDFEREYKYKLSQYECMISHLHGWVRETLHSQTLDRS